HINESYRRIVISSTDYLSFLCSKTLFVISIYSVDHLFGGVQISVDSKDRDLVASYIYFITKDLGGLLSALLQMAPGNARLPQATYGFIGVILLPSTG